MLRAIIYLVTGLTLLGAAGCVRQWVVSGAADALASGGGGAFARDEDPELIGEALPFGLKVMESLLDETPEHEPLLLALAAGFTQYAQGFVLPRAERAEVRDAEEIRQRAKRLHLRAHRYGRRALELRHPGFAAAFAEAPAAAVARLETDDLPFIYWTGAPLLAAVALGADDMTLLAELPRGEALVHRAVALDPDWGEGLLHELLIAYEGRGEALGGSVTAAEQHFARAVALQGGRRAAPFVALAEAVPLKLQDRLGFTRLLEQALAVDLDLAPEHRLANVLAQRRARWLLEHLDDLFL